jgi:hypothetical protein
LYRYRSAYFDVFLGAHNVRLTSEPTRVEVRATQKIIHPTWNPSTLAGDIALIRLPSPVTLNSKFLILLLS